MSSVSTPTEIEASAILKMGEKNSKALPPIKGSQAGKG
jgi:hypothetical protein